MGMFREIDVAGVSLGVYLKYFVLEMENMTQQTLEYEIDGSETSYATAFQLYHSVMELYALKKKRCPE
jgi:hypothetical protein